MRVILVARTTKKQKEVYFRCPLTNRLLQEVPYMTTQITCKICDKSIINLGQHVRMAHKIKPQEYYDTFIKEPTEGICMICSKATRYVDTNRGYKKYCSNLCSNKDKDLQRIKTQSYMDTLANNPSINTKRNKTISAMWQSNPDLIKQRVATLQQTLRNNPSIIKEREQKRKIKEQLNPQINIDRGTSVSIGLRNFYNERKELCTTLPYQMYLLKHTEKDIIKIGITKNLPKRIGELKRDFGAIECVHTINGPYNMISKLEQSLHNYFSSHCEVQPTGNGRTEWFNSIIINEVLNKMILDYDATNV